MEKCNAQQSRCPARIVTAPSKKRARAQRPGCRRARHGPTGSKHTRAWRSAVRRLAVLRRKELPRTLPLCPTTTETCIPTKVAQRGLQWCGARGSTVPAASQLMTAPRPAHAHTQPPAVLPYSSAQRFRAARHRNARRKDSQPPLQKHAAEDLGEYVEDHARLPAPTSLTASPPPPAHTSTAC